MPDRGLVALSVNAHCGQVHLNARYSRHVSCSPPQSGKPSSIARILRSGLTRADPAATLLNLLRSAATVSGFTLLSRVTGLARETLIASAFGAGPLTDAFFVAQRLPNMLRRMVAEGAFSQAFVPLLAQSRRQALEAGDDEAAMAATRLLVNQVATALFWALLAITIIGIVAAPALVALVASGLTADPAVFNSAVVMTRIMFPYILLVSLVALSAGILNTWQQFSLPAFTPVLLNVCIIASALGLSRFFDPPIYALALGVLLGGIAQLALQVPALMRVGMLPRISFDIRGAFADAGTRHVLSKMAPAILGVSAAQISLLINTHIASLLAPGSVSWVSFGDRLMEFPSGLLGVALGTVLLPSLSAAAREAPAERFSGLLDWGLRLCVLLALPSALALAILAEPLTAALFHYGRFDAHDVAMTAAAVRGYSIGLVALIGIKVLAPGFFARQNVSTPVRIAIIALVVTQLLNIVFVPQFAHAGLAMSISFAAWLNAGLLLAGLLRGGHFVPRPGWTKFLLQTGAACAALVALLLWAAPQFDWIALRATPGMRLGWVAALVIGGVATYGAVLLAGGIRPRQFSRESGPI